jgi:nickel-type superoxide dismutase maturation protease
LIIKILKVLGDSLSPEFKNGDYLFISMIPILLGFLKMGDVVVFTHRIYGRMVKRVSDIDRERNVVHVKGTHEYSVDSEQLGPISKKDLKGKVIWHIPAGDNKS